MTTDADPIDVAVLVEAIFEALDIRYTIGGSIASSLAGEPRSTIDIDFVAELTDDSIAPLTSALEPGFYVSEDALRRAVRDQSTANLIHQETSIKVDVFVAGGTPLDRQQISRRQAVNVGRGRILYVHPPEDILLQKLHWYRKGGEISDRQWRDILGIIRVQGARLDTPYLAANAPLLRVGDLLTRALHDAQR